MIFSESAVCSGECLRGIGLLSVGIHEGADLAGLIDCSDDQFDAFHDGGRLFHAPVRILSFANVEHVLFLARCAPDNVGCLTGGLNQAVEMAAG